MLDTGREGDGRASREMMARRGARRVRGANNDTRAPAQRVLGLLVAGGNTSVEREAVPVPAARRDAAQL